MEPCPLCLRVDRPLTREHVFARPRQRLDFALDVMPDRDAPLSRVRSVAVLVDDVVGHVAARGSLSSGHGTRVWPLRTHALRWDTLPVIRR